jgi:hypothetical protein
MVQPNSTTTVKQPYRGGQGTPPVHGSGSSGASGPGRGGAGVEVGTGAGCCGFGLKTETFKD